MIAGATSAVILTAACIVALVWVCKHYGTPNSSFFSRLRGSTKARAVEGLVEKGLADAGFASRKSGNGYADELVWDSGELPNFGGELAWYECVECVACVRVFVRACMQLNLS
jgi:hypothetical protein